MINFLPRSCAISPLPAEPMLSFASRALCQQSCCRRKGFSLLDFGVLLTLQLLAVQSKAASSTQQHAASPGIPLVGSQPILRSGNFLFVVSSGTLGNRFLASSRSRISSKFFPHSTTAMSHSHAFSKEAWISALD